MTWLFCSLFLLSLYLFTILCEILDLSRAVELFIKYVDVGNLLKYNKYNKVKDNAHSHYFISVFLYKIEYILYFFFISSQYYIFIHFRIADICNWKRKKKTNSFENNLEVKKAIFLLNIHMEIPFLLISNNVLFLIRIGLGLGGFQHCCTKLLYLLLGCFQNAWRQSKFRISLSRHLNDAAFFPC